ncbi:MAG: hypothetical protein QOD03_1491, partial [Verrucomicrobiota bacterium]
QITYIKNKLHFGSIYPSDFPNFFLALKFITD